MSLLRTARLNLRLFGLGDAPFILELLNEPGFLTYIGDKGVRTLGDARDYLRQGPLESYAQHGFGLYAVELCDGARPAPIGMCGLVRREGLDEPDVGFAFLQRYCGLGYASEAAAGVVHHAATVLRLPRLLAVAAADNHGSAAVLRKIGMRFTGWVRLRAQADELRLFALNTTVFPAMPADSQA